MPELICLGLVDFVGLGGGGMAAFVIAIELSLWEKMTVLFRVLVFGVIIFEKSGGS